MTYRDFAKKQPLLAEILIPLVAGIVSFAVLVPFIPWGLAFVAGIVIGALVGNQAY